MAGWQNMGNNYLQQWASIMHICTSLLDRWILKQVHIGSTKCLGNRPLGFETAVINHS